MSRFIVERVFPDGLEIPTTAAGAEGVQQVIDNNSAEQVTWLSSFVSGDRTKTFCVYDAPNAEAVRRAAIVNEMPVDQVTEVRVLDPYFYIGATP